MIPSLTVLRLQHRTDEIPAGIGADRMIVHSRLEGREVPLPSRRLGSVKMVVRGEEEYRADGTRYLLRPGQLLWVPAGIPMLSSVRQGRAAEGVCLYGDLDTEAPDEPHMLALPRSLELALHTLAQALNHPEHERVQHAYGQATAAWRRFNQRRTEARRRLSLQREESAEDMALRLARAEDRIASESHLALSNDTLAQEACLSAFAFARRFQEAFGQSPHALLVEQRIAKAQSLLQTQDAPALGTVAEAVGYADLPSFSKAFRRCVGTSPSQWRTKMSTNRQG